MRVAEIFQSLQGEGRFQGQPVLFIRLSGCTRKCSWCDSKYHYQGSEYTIEQVKELILESSAYNGIDTVVWTGGEPLLQIDEINRVQILVKQGATHHLETNGDLIKNTLQLQCLIHNFKYISISPKELKIAKRISNLLRNVLTGNKIDIKIVTDLDKVNIDMLKYATSLMPLSTYNKRKDEQIRKRVWNYCVEHNLHYSARLHVINFGKKRKI